MDAADKFVLDFTNEIVMGYYLARNVYNADETGMFWRVLPDSTLAMIDEQQAYGGKLSKERVTLMLCANAEGSHKIDLLAIGKAARPRGFPKNFSDLPVKYKNSKKAWMTREIFEWWYDHVFIPQVEEFQARNNKHEDVLLLLDNAPVHNKAFDYTRLNGRFKVLFLPPNVTSVLQPMDQAIIATFKRHYRRNLLEKLIGSVDKDGNPNPDGFMKEFKLISALDYFRIAWANVTTASLRNGWKTLFERIEWTGQGEFFVAETESAEPDAFVDWYSVDADDPGFGVACEDDIETEFFGDLNVVDVSDVEGEDEEMLSGENGTQAIVIEEKAIVIEEEEVISSPISNADALNAGITFLKWFEDLKDVDGKDKTDLQRIVQIATIRSQLPKKALITEYFSTMA